MLWFSAAMAVKSGRTGSGAAFEPGFHPGGSSRGTHVGVEARPGAVGDDRVQPGVQRIDQRLVVRRDRPRDEIIQTEGVFDDLGRIACLHGALRLLRRRHPGIELPGLQTGVDGVVVGELHRLQFQGVDDIGLLHRALHNTDPLAGSQLVEPRDRGASRDDEREVSEVVSVREADGAAPGVGRGDRRRAHVEATRCHLGQQPGELGAHEVDLQTELVGDGAQQLVVEPGELAPGVDADARRRVRQCADGQGARPAESQCVHVDRVEGLDRRGGVLVGGGTRCGCGQVGRQGTGAFDPRR